jgi:hypothetical protein
MVMPIFKEMENNSMEFIDEFDDFFTYPTVLLLMLQTKCDDDNVMMKCEDDICRWNVKMKYANVKMKYANVTMKYANVKMKYADEMWRWNMDEMRRANFVLMEEIPWYRWKSER